MPRRSQGVSQFVPKKGGPFLGLPGQASLDVSTPIDGAMQAFNPLWPSILQDWMKPYQNTGHCFPQVGSGRGWRVWRFCTVRTRQAKVGHEWLER